MFCDAHCHPFDLLDFINENELETMLNGITCVTSSWDLEQFEYSERLAARTAAAETARVIPGYAIHPQLPLFVSGDFKKPPEERQRDYDIHGTLLPLLEKLAAEKRLGAVGETGFDLFDAQYKLTEKIQDEIFAFHLETALKYDLPMVLHVRKAMHKVFENLKVLRKVCSVIFHSWRGTLIEGESLLRHGVNVYFSFGAAIINNHKQAQRCCAVFPADRLLLETDAPYLPPQGKKFSTWADLPVICQRAADLRKAAGSPCCCFEDVEMQCESNFLKAFNIDFYHEPHEPHEK